MDGFHQRFKNVTEDISPVIDEIDRITALKAGDFIRLNYKRLTYDDFIGAILDRDLAPMDASAFDNIKRKELALVDEVDFDSIDAARNYATEVSDRFTRVADADNADDAWKERIYDIWNKVPAALVDASISRESALLGCGSTTAKENSPDYQKPIFT